MAQASKILDGSQTPKVYESEIRVPRAGTWLGLGAGMFVVVAAFVWTIL